MKTTTDNLNIPYSLWTYAIVTRKTRGNISSQQSLCGNRHHSSPTWTPSSSYLAYHFVFMIYSLYITLFVWLFFCAIQHAYRVHNHRGRSFYSASALLAMPSAVIARGIVSVRPSVTFRCCVQMNECKVYPDIRREHPSGGVKVRHPLSIAKIWPIICHNLETAQYRR